MKFKTEIIIISLIMIMLFTVSAACAADSEIQTLDAQNSTDELVSTVNDDDLKMDDSNEILDETGNLDDLNYTINGNSDTYVELDKNYTGRFDGGNGIPINRADVVIDGKGHTIDCTGQNSRIFNIHVDGITLKNIKFVGGYSEYGGAIYTNRNLTIINCTFMDNQATSYGGGAIYADNVKMSICGGTFINNHASSDGGAIDAVGEAPDDYEIFNCTFIGNSANGKGGAFYSNAAQNMGNIIDSTFINNRASAGDAVYNYGYEGTIDRCVFINNTANSMICSGDYATMIVSNSIIVNNYGDDLLHGFDMIMDYNWWGTTADDEDAPVVSGSTPNKYYILNMTADDDSADITLNNLYDENGVLTTSYANYALPSINFTVKGKNVEVADSVVLGTAGTATIEHAPAGKYVITIGYNGVSLTREVKPSFKWLKDAVNSDGNEVFLDQDCIYDSARDCTLTNGIEFAKDMTIDGQGHVIDAKGLSNIIYFDDDTNSYSLTLKNIVFANAVGNDGAAVYFKGNKLEIINCTFINNKADSEGDAVYVANALNRENIITKSLFTENTGSNSVAFINLDSSAILKVDNSIFIGNNASKNIIATGNVSADYNWWGNTNENNADISRTEGVNVTKWLFLKIDAVATLTGDATLSLNNLYDNGQNSTYDEYALKPLTFTLGGSKATVSVPKITLGDDGCANYQFRMDRAVATLTASHCDATASAQLRYVIVDDGSFRALNEIIFLSDDDAVIELTRDYVYRDNDTITEGIVIPRKITINGNGHTIDANGTTRIFLVPEGVSNVTINNISFINAKASYGSVIVISHYADYFNMSNCNFTDNVATDYGGVLDCVGDYCTIENCNFINNRAVSKAGVIRYYHDSEAYIKNSNFINNRVADGSSGGGVIYVDTGAVNIGRSVFIDNVANDKPGSVLYTTKSATITNSIFLNNPGAYTIYGGSGVKLTNNWFGNTSADYGSFADGNKTVSVVYHETTLNNWLYLDIKFLDDRAIISLNNAYDKSSASTGVISNCNLPELTLNINSTTLGLNTDEVTLDANGQARAYYADIPDGAKLTVSNDYVSLTKDAVVSDFDVLQEMVNEKDVFELTRDYEYCTVDSITEGVVVSRNITIDGKGHTIDAKEMTRIFNVQASDVTIKNIIFVNGKTSQDGGAICITSNGGNYNIENCTFLNNTAEGKGGAITVNANNAKFNLYNSTFTGNRADGALYIETNNTEITIDKCIFTENGSLNDSSQISASAIVWKSTNDTGNSTVKNSIFLNNGIQNDNGMYVFLLVSGTVDIGDNWWGTDSHNAETFNSSFVGGMTPDSWLFINSSVSSNSIAYNGTAKIRYYLQAYNGTDATDFDNSKVPYVDFNISCDTGELDKDKVALNEEFTFRATDVGTAIVDAYYNGIAYETYVNGPYMVPRSDVPFLMYANQTFSKGEFVKTADGNYANVTVTCNVSSFIRFVSDDDVALNTTEGTAKLTFSYDGSIPGYTNGESFDFTVKVLKIPMTINVTNDVSEITLYAFETFDLGISFVIDEIHKAYASAWNVSGFDFDSDIISFTYDCSERLENGSWYPTGHIKAKASGNTTLTIYSASDVFSAESYTINITVKKIPTEIAFEGNDSFKVDDISNINASFYINDTRDTQTQLIYESSNENVLNFTSDAGDFNATGNGTAVITVTFAGNSTHEGSSSTITVTVTKHETAVNITSGRELSLLIDETSQIEASLNPDVGVLEYFTDNVNIATVENGLITAVGNGTAVITVKYSGTWKYEASQDTITVVVSKIPTRITAEDMELNVTDENIEIGASVNVTGESVLGYSSSNESIVLVSADGRITAVGGGRAQVTVTYAGTEKYAASNKTITVTVKKIKTGIIVSENTVSTVYGETVTITQTVVDGNGTEVNVGEVSYFIGDESIVNPFIVNRVGEFNVTVKYAGTTRYEASETNITVISIKANNTINVTVVDAVYPDKVIVNVTAEQDDNYTVDINGTLVKVEVVNGVGQNMTLLSVGSYFANITGYDSPFFNGITGNDTFTVSKGDSTISIEVLNGSVYVFEDIIVTANVTDGAIGNVTFTLLGADMTADVGKNATFTGLSEGNYSLYAVYNGDNNYRPSEKVNITIHVVKNNLNLDIAVDDITYGENLIVNVTTNAKFTGDVLVEIGELNKTVHIVNGTGNVTFDKLEAGEYSINASFTENDFFYESDANDTFTVSKAYCSFVINVPHEILYVDEAIDVVSILPDDAIGNVTFTIIGQKTAGVNEHVIFDGLSAGDYVINATYNGDKNYKVSNAEGINIIVVRYSTEVVVDENRISTSYGKTVEINSRVIIIVNGSEVDEGNVEFFIGDESIVNPFTVDRVGEFNIAVRYSQTPKYEASEVNVTVISDKANNTINITVDDAVYPNNVTVRVNAEQDGNYTVDINGTVVNVEVVGGTGQNTTQLPAGSYYANIKGYSSPLFYGVTTNDTFTVSQGEFTVVIDVLDDIIYVGEAFNVTAVVPGDATGNVTFTLGDDITVDVGENATFAGLAYGNYTLYATYNGDNNYKASKKANVTIRVIKYDLNLDVAVDNITYGENLTVNVTTNAGFTGNVSVKIGELNRAVQIVNGMGNVTFDKLAAGEYNITASFTEYGSFYGAETNKTFTVSKAEFAVVIQVLDNLIYVGEAFNVTAILPGDATGNVTLTITDGKTVDVMENATFEGLSAGDHIIYAVYNGDNNYKASKKANVTISVVKYETVVVVDENRISTSYLETIKINATVFNNVNGSKVDDGNVEFFIGEESILIPFTVDRVGEFNITVRCAETPKYLASEVNVTVISDKANNTINVSVDDAVYHDNVTVRVTADQDGNYTVDINGTPVDVEVVGGVGQNTVALPAGSYYANITGYESPLFYGVTTNDAFTVSKAESSISIDVNVVVYVYEDIKVTAVVSADATGNVTFTLGDEKTINVGENATFAGLAYGNYTIYAIYNGDSNYKASNKVNATIRVIKYDLDLVVAAGDITYGENLTVNVNTNEKFTGDVLVKIGELNQTVKVNNGTGNVAFANLNAGKYLVTATFTENGMFYGATANDTFTVSKAESSVKIIVLNDIIHVDEAIRVTAIVPADATGNVTFTLMTADNTVDVGENATFAGLAYGNYTVYAIYNGDNNYNPSNEDNVAISVVKYETVIRVDENQISTRYLDKITLNPTVYNVNGSEVDEGSVSFFIGDESIVNPFTVDRVGEFNITVKYVENSKYLASEVNVAVVSDKADNIIVVSVDDAVYHDNVTVRVDADQDGNYTVDINGTLVDVEVVGGAGQNTIALPAGSYYANITGYSSPLFYGVATNDVFTIAQDELTVKIVVLNDVIHVDEDILVTAVVPSDATGNVTFSLLTADNTVDVGENATFAGLAYGNYTIYAIYNGDNNYKASAEASVLIRVVKYETEIIVDKNQISTRYLDEIAINSTVVIVNGAEVDYGNVSFFIGDESIANPFIVDRVGEFNITVKYAENSKYLASEVNVAVVSDKADNIIVVSVDDVVYLNNATVNVAAGQDGNYTVDINGTLVDVEVVGGVGQNTIALPAGSYYANITGYESPLFYGVATNDMFTVDKAESSVKIVVLDDVIYVYEDILVTAVVPGDATGNVTFKLLTIDNTVDVGENATFSGLAYGNYVISAIYNGDNNYKASMEVTVSIGVIKYDLDLSISVDDITYGEKLVVNVSTSENFTGEVLVDVGKLSQAVQVNNGVGNVTFDNLAAGEYVIMATFIEDDIFYGMAVDDEFTVNQAESSIEIVVLDDVIYVYEDILVTAVVPADATGNVTFTLISDNTVGVGENTTFKGLPYGNYTIYAIYNGDNNYKASYQANVSISVIKYDLNLSISVDDITYGENLVVNVSTDAKFTGDVLVDIGVLNQTVKVSNGTGGVAFANLSAGDYFITATFIEDDIFYGMAVNDTFTVNQAESSIEIIVLDDVIYVYEDILVTAVVLADATGNVTFRLIGDSTVGVGDNATFTGLPYGNYTIYVVYNGDNNYKASKEVNVTISVIKYDINLKVDVDDITYGGKLAVNVTTSENFTGDVLVDIGSLNQTVQVSNGTGSVTFANLTAGTYLITATFSEDDIFYGMAVNDTFTVNKVDSTIEIIVLNDVIHVGEPIMVTSVVPGDATGNVTFTLIGDNTVGIDENATFAGLAYGNYTIYAVYNGDNNYKASTKANVSISVIKYDFNLEIAADNITYGENLVVKVTTNERFTGNLTVYAGDNAETAQITNGVGNATFANLAKGDYLIRVNFTGDGSFYADAKDTAATVTGFNTPLVIDYSVPLIQHNVTVTVTMAGDLNDNVTVIVDGISEIMAVINGSLVFDVAKVPHGTHNITVSFTGNDKYYSAKNSTSFFVEYLDADLKISAETVTYGEPLVVVVRANDNLAGNVTVAIGNLTQTARVVDGLGNISFDGLAVGNYSITAEFACDETFDSASADTVGTVESIEVPANQTMDTEFPANAKSSIFSFSLENATGNFTVIIDGEVIATVELVNGCASITVDNMPAGNYNVTLIYSGDDVYAPIVQSASLTVNKVATSISASKVSKVYGVSKKLTLTLKDANNVALSKKRVKIVLNGVTYKRTTNAKGQVTLKVSKNLKVKTYAAKIIFDGDSEYLKSSKDVKVVVKKAKSKITAKKKTFKAKKKVKRYTITLKANNKPIKKVKVTLKINGKKYKAKTNSKGKATFKIKKLAKKGKYKATVRFAGNKNYKATSKKVRITVKK